MTASTAPPTGLIRSAYRYAKKDRFFHAGLDPATATVRVYAGDAPAGHGLTAHYERTAAEAPAHIASLVDAALAGAAPEPAGRGVRTFTFLPTSRCNMGCDYCGQVHEPGSMPPAVRSRFAARARAAFDDPGIHHVHVAWFGGEPLLAYRAVVELSAVLVGMSERTGTRYSSKMTTNGALLTPARMRTLVEDARVGRFDITVDGPAEVHDRHRPLKSGARSFDAIVETLTWFRDADLSRPAVVVLRTNVDRGNVAHVDEYLRAMKALGFDDPARFMFELAPIHSWGNDVSAIALPTPEAARREIAWMERLEELSLPYGLLPGKPSGVTCVATDPLAEVIDSRGNLFSCTEYPLTPQAGADRLAHVVTLPVTAPRPRGPFAGWDAAVAAGGLPCSTCPLRPICRGACPKQWSEGTVPCPTMKLNLDDRLAIFMRRHGYRTVDAA